MGWRIRVARSTDDIVLRLRSWERLRGYFGGAAACPWLHIFGYHY